MSLKSNQPAPSKANHTVQEDRITAARRGCYIGRFRVMVDQTRGHPEQRVLDADWVKQLVEKFQDNLNRPLHPVDAVLEVDTDLQAARACLRKSGQSDVPVLPAGVRVLVFSGQHRLAALSELPLHQDELWWHADIFTRSESRIINSFPAG